jgi:hypothetical protein
MTDPTHPASFRDPSGFLYRKGSQLYRQVNRIYQPQYDALMSSGLYPYLTDKGWLIPHRESQTAPRIPTTAYKIIQPDPIRFVSYPYEWCFGQLKDAALLTLKIAKSAVRYGLTLKDASAYNIQFHDGKPILIDTLSFDDYIEGEPWIAYRQFCQHFLAPLALMAHADVRMNQLLRIWIDGIPLDLASRLLPLRTRFSPGLLLHLHVHAGMQKKTSSDGKNNSRKRVSRSAFQGLIESLLSTIRNLHWKPAGTEWAEYYEGNNYTEHKTGADLGPGREHRRLQPDRRRKRQPGRLLRQRLRRGGKKLPRRQSPEGNPAAAADSRFNESFLRHRLGKPRAGEFSRTRPGRRGSGARDRPPSGDRQ